MAGNELLLTVAEVGALLRVSRATVWRWIEAGRVPAYSLPGGGVRVRRDDAAAVLAPARAGVAGPHDGNPLEDERLVALVRRVLERERGEAVPAAPVVLGEFYGGALDDHGREELAAAGAVRGLGGEVAVLRVLLRRLLREESVDGEAVLRMAGLLVRAAVAELRLSAMDGVAGEQLVGLDGVLGLLRDAVGDTGEEAG